MARSNRKMFDTLEPYQSKDGEMIEVDHSADAAFFSFFSKLLNTHEAYDVNLQCQGTVIHAHRIVLMANSGYFRKLFANNEASFDGLSQYDISVAESVFLQLQRYLYTGKVCVYKSAVEEFENFAETFEIDKLKNEFARFRLSEVDITAENCLETWSVGHFLHDPAMIDVGKRCSMELFQVILDSPGFLSLPYECAQEILSNDQTDVQSAEERLVYAINWVSHDPSRNTFLKELLAFLPLKKMSSAFLKQCLRDPVIAAHKEGTDILNRAISDCVERLSSEFSTNPIEIKTGQSSVAVIGPMRKNFDGERKYVGIKVQLLNESFSDDIQTLTDLPFKLHDKNGVASTFGGHNLMVSGLGPDSNELWRFCLKAKVWEKMCTFNESRRRHSMTWVTGSLVILGGYDPETGTNQKSVHVVEMSDKGFFMPVKPKDIQSRGRYGLTVSQVLNGSDLVAVVRNTDKIQVYSTEKNKVTQVCRLPFQSTNEVNGMVVFENQVLLSCGIGSYIIPAEGIYKGNSSIVQKLNSKFTSPNVLCGVYMCGNAKLVFLVGGRNRDSDMPDTHPLYAASTQGLISNSKEGWMKIDSNWPFRNTEIFTSACCTINHK